MRIALIVSIFLVLAIIFVTARLWTRFRIVKAPGYDDLMIILALICAIALSAMVFVELHYGLGKPGETLSKSSFQGHLFFLWLAIPLYNTSLILAKLSALIFLLRVFRARRFVIFTYGFMAVLTAAGLWMLFSSIFLCRPIHKFWDVSYPRDRGYCLPRQPIWYFNAGFQIASDMVILVMPMPMLWKLHLPWRQKAGIIAVFGTGIVVIAISIARTLELRLLFLWDFSKNNGKAATWSSLEADVSIICACMAPMHPLLSRIFSWCFRPQPLHSSPATKTRSVSGTTAHLTSSRKHSIYDPNCPDGGMQYQDYFFSGPGSYTASVSKIDTNEDALGHHGGSDEDGIRVVRELRMVSDVAPTPPILTPGWDQSRDIEMEAGFHFKSQAAQAADGINHHDFQYECDLGDFEFPDYKERMNAPV
ncbi:Uncharacterized protein PECH_000034 [Penicillium ucsense]|uniref:Rhodopsin domain-containing protein n=1 Tax=Penicillium ucsense TaxID=2839758 RepID=A0A8J8W048_9EURO|nr:Uncharacterized protein PECM_007740 [Penicillium ucsense]KAF7739522.1 Uncharacterized protein PECH_000034 [Penicillium ucsense]